jgi:hypothetical protein
VFVLMQKLLIALYSTVFRLLIVHNRLNLKPFRIKRNTLYYLERCHLNQQNSAMNDEYEGSNMNISDIEEEKTISVTSFAQNANRTKHISIKKGDIRI